jgi:hypothetical protein
LWYREPRVKTGGWIESKPSYRKEIFVNYSASHPS